MAQYIGLRRESESGAVLAMFEPDGIPLEILDLAPSDSACARFIDPYGDSVFNQLQLPVLIEELRAMSGRGSSLFDERLLWTIAFLEESRDVHVYVRFLGD